MKELTPKQKEVLRRLLYEDLTVVANFNGIEVKNCLAKPWKWDIKGNVHTRVMRELKKKELIKKTKRSDGGNEYLCFDITREGFRAVADLKIVEKAIKILSPGAKKFKPREEKYYFVAEDEDGNQFDEFESHEMSTVCEECVEGTRQEIQDQLNKDGLFGIPKSATISAEQDTFSEVEGFCYCDKCTELIASSTLPSRDEIDHWENEIKEESFFDKLWPQESYELTGVLEWHTDDPALTPRIEEIARLLVDGAEKKNIKEKNDNR